MELQDRGPWTSRRARRSSRLPGPVSSSWTGCLPRERIVRVYHRGVLDRYSTVAADTPQEANTFKFYQLKVVLNLCDGRLRGFSERGYRTDY